MRADIPILEGGTSRGSGKGFAVPMVHRPVIRFVLASSILVGLAAPAMAQLPGQTGGRQSSNAAAPVDFGDVLEALGRWLVHTVRSDRDAPTVDEPRWNQTGSPRATVMTFLENVEYLRQGRDEAWPRVRQTLPEDGDLAGRERALELARIFDRLGEVSGFQLASEDQVREKGLRRYRLFPGAIDPAPVWNALDGAPRGQLVLAVDPEGNWRFSAETMRGVPELLESLAAIPPRTATFSGGLDLPPLLDLGVPPAERLDWWLVSLFVFTGAGAGVLARWGMRRLARGLRRRHRRVVSRTLEELASPALSACVLAGLVLASTTVALHPGLAALRWQLTGLLTVMVLGYFLYRLVPVFGEALGGAAADGHVAGTAVPLLVRIVQVVLVAFVAVVVLDGLFSVNLAGLVAGFGILGLALGLAAQESVRNWFGALTISLARPFSQGDWIIHNGEFARVMEIGLNATKLRLATGEQLTVPNMKFIDQEVQNTTQRPWLRREMDLAFPYGTTPGRMEEILEIVRESLDDDEVRKEGKFEETEHEPHITFHAFGDDHLTVKVYYWFHVEPGESGWYAYLAHCDTVNRALLARLHEKGVQFAFPTRTVRLANAGDELRVGGPGATDDAD